MYFWNSGALAHQLKSKTLPQSEKVKYLLATVTLYAIGLEISLGLSSPMSLFGVIQSITSVVLVFLGTVFCYKVNSRGDNQEFIDRYICLGWPLTIKIFLLGLSVYLLYFVIGVAIKGENFEKSLDSPSIFDLFLTALIPIIFYWRLATHLRWVSSEVSITEITSGAAKE
jgi:hypothetical protein